MNKFVFFVFMVTALTVHASNMLYINEYQLGADIPYSLEQLFQQIRKNSAFVATYSQERTLPHLKKPLITQGEFAYESSVGIEIRQKIPFITTTQIQPDKIIQTNADGSFIELPLQGQVQFVRMAELMEWLFHGNLKPLMTEFNIWYNAENGVQQVGLKPKSVVIRQFIQSITLEFKGARLLWMEIKESEKASTKWIFSHQNNLRSGQAIPASGPTQ